MAELMGLPTLWRAVAETAGAHVFGRADAVRAAESALQVTR